MGNPVEGGKKYLEWHWHWKYNAIIYTICFFGFFLTHQAWGRATTWADETTACIESGVRHIFNLHISTAKSKITFQPRWNPTLKQNLIPESQFLKGARLLVKRVVFPPNVFPAPKPCAAARLLIYEKCGAPLAPDVLAAQLPTEHFMAVWQIDRADIGVPI